MNIDDPRNYSLEIGDMVFIEIGDMVFISRSWLYKPSGYVVCDIKPDKGQYKVLVSNGKESRLLPIKKEGKFFQFVGSQKTDITKIIKLNKY